MRTTLAWLATLSLLACSRVGPGPNDILDARSPFASGASSGARTCTDKDRAAASAEWAKLRRSFPYHLQTIAVSPPFQSGCRALIVTEPPPEITLAALRQVDPVLLDSSKIERHTIGYDGWTRDVVFTIAPLSRSALADTAAALHATMFGTTYGVQIVDTNTRRPSLAPRQAPLDIAIGPGDLNRWLVADTTPKFEPLLGGEPRPLRALLEARRAGVYIDAADGLVAWIIPRHADIARMGAIFRQFAIESDLVVGAISSEESVAVIARRRVVDPLIFSPLRFETASLLAAVDNPRLGQSYERTHFLAGKTSEWKDWAPIYLSPELVNTEYGSVLNITDQLLKSWSNNGVTKYHNFDYTPPGQWAFPAPLGAVVESGGLTFNWNTSNASAAIQIDDVEVFWLRRTGALNVSYFPDDGGAWATPRDDSFARFEETAYGFFARSQDPFLVRVVQYNALYQIFERYALESSFKPATDPDTGAERAAQQAVRSTLSFIRDGDLKAFERRLASLPRSVSADTRRGAAQTALFLSFLTRNLSGPELDMLATALAAGRDVRELQLADALRMPYVAFQRYQWVTQLLSDRSFYATYARSANTSPARWIRTPTVVISWNEEPLAQGIGGHSLGARIREVAYEPRRRAATPMDQTGAPVTVVGTAELDRLVLGQQGPTLAPAAVRRSPEVALGRGGGHDAPRLGWRRTDLLAAEEVPDEILVEKLDMSYVLKAGNRRVEVSTAPEVAEVLASLSSTKATSHIHFSSNLGPDQVRGIINTAHARFAASFRGVIDRNGPRLAGRKLDFSNAKIVADSRPHADGAGQIGIRVEVPAAQSRLRVAIKIALRKVTPEQLQRSKGQAESGVRSVLDQLQGNPATIREVDALLRSKLEEVLQEKDIQLKFQGEALDFTSVQIMPTMEPYGTDRHAG